MSENINTKYDKLQNVIKNIKNEIINEVSSKNDAFYNSGLSRALQIINNNLKELNTK